MDLLSSRSNYQTFCEITFPPSYISKLPVNLHFTELKIYPETTRQTDSSNEILRTKTYLPIIGTFCLQFNLFHSNM